MIRVNHYVRVVRGGKIDTSVSHEQVFSYATNLAASNETVAANPRQQGAALVIVLFAV